MLIRGGKDGVSVVSWNEKGKGRILGGFEILFAISLLLPMIEGKSKYSAQNSFVVDVEK
jgi:hypothetical protein